MLVVTLEVSLVPTSALNHHNGILGVGMRREIGPPDVSMRLVTEKDRELRSPESDQLKVVSALIRWRSNPEQNEVDSSPSKCRCREMKMVLTVHRWKCLHFFQTVRKQSNHQTLKVLRMPNRGQMTFECEQMTESLAFESLGEFLLCSQIETCKLA